MTLEIKLTPRKLERIVLLAIIIILLGALYYYGYDQCNAFGNTPASENETSSGETTDTEEESDDTTEDSTPASDPETTPAPQASSSSGTLDGKLAISIADFDVDPVDDSYDIKKVKISVRNGKESHLSGLSVDITKYDKVDIGSEWEATMQPNVKDLKISAIPSGGSISNTYSISIPAVHGKGKLKFVFKQNNKKLEEINKNV
ncbi:MAG: hypothetical protein QF632_05070 [Candidatus Woesearchaeota archaeon]|jgi:hypothetical protein|nr:hypothetical protein [Candidatus Woesearchaeota archaeon]MDP7324102.1 hypothetical protein [Candidatus Woesearchaeota archaeon]MDP7458011.1 hypothetical protein [Candidatus Woesearchaeota archaeon]